MRRQAYVVKEAYAVPAQPTSAGASLNCLEGHHGLSSWTLEIAL